jgi:mono/diheme cytochrome c family protein
MIYDEVILRRSLHCNPPLPAPTRFVILALAVMLTATVTAADTPPPSSSNLPVPPDHAKKMAQGLELFRTHVGGLLTQHCITCHGADKIKGDLDLTTREGLLRGGTAGPAVVPGKAMESRLHKLISHAEKPHMPQKAAKLPDQAIAQIAAWIDAGAPYDKPLVANAPVAKGRPNVTDEDRQFWSFQPLKPGRPPAAKNPVWCRTPIDQFVMAKLETNGIAANPPADRRHLIRRAYFDLIGLPPTPEAIEAFENDPAPDAYEKVVNRLLASPHYGEQWGRHWLDLARFAESHGYEQDYDRPSAYHFRDFVIQALNQDMPYDQFVKWQIAGDEFAPDDALALMATGYLAAGTHATQITANQVEKERYDELDDMAATIGTSMLGVTIGCARCHDHKFDPIPQKDYYRLVSTFTSTVRSEMELDFHPERFRAAKAEFDRQHRPLVEALERFEKEHLPARLEKWLKTAARPPQPRWLILEPISFKSNGGATLTRLKDLSYLASGTNPASDTYTVVAKTPLQGITAVRLEALAHPSMVKGGPGRASNGNFALSDFRLTAAPRGSEGGEKVQPIAVKLVNPKATFEQKGLPVKAAIDDDKKSAWAVDPQFGMDHAAVFELDNAIGFNEGTVLTFTLKFENNTGHNIGRPRLAVSNMPNPADLGGESGLHHQVLEIQRILQIPRERWTAEQKASVSKWYRTTDLDWQKLNQAVQDHLQKAPQPQLTKVLVASEGVKPIRLHTQGADFFDKTYFLKRGDLNQKEGEAPQGFLQVLMRTPEAEKHWQVAPPQGWRTSYRRRSLANWITDANAGAGHLLARVIVNRLWQHHLGRGIVATPSDFGAQGERPTHPELLDWLAAELIRQGWRLKPIHRLIMTSSVYRQNAEFDPERAHVDPNNRLYWHWSRRRLEGEVIRDAMLAVSGSLDQTMFGPGSLKEDHRRRSIYFTIKRSQLIPLMILFDGPDTLQSMPNRPSTTTAPQAMALMNHPQVRAYARNLALRLQPPDDSSLAEAAQTGYRLALGRLPKQDELAATLVFLQSQVASYRAAGKPEALQFALADFCQALMSLNEFVYVD